MFKEISNIAQLFRQAQEMRSRFGELQAQLADVREQGEAGGGLVRIEATGELRVVACQLDPTLMPVERDREFLEELLVAAINQALEKARQSATERMQSATSDIPGMSDLMSRLNPGS
ncbi:MAG: YbaB/EbfC family nucleoid-associated protein [Planctomyces sp.]|nr:YbaB/EbfC family nucleoid-associated protein [Planctomyces sp.]